MALAFNSTNATLNNLKQILLHIAEGHSQVNSFGWGEEYDISSVTVENYPLLWVLPLPSVINEQAILYKFRLGYFDLVDADQTNETEVQSDAINVLRDFMYILRDGYDLEVIFGATVTPFTEKYNDRTSGWYIDMSINVLQSYGACDAPYINQGF